MYVVCSGKEPFDPPPSPPTRQPVHFSHSPSHRQKQHKLGTFSFFLVLERGKVSSRFHFVSCPSFFFSCLDVCTRMSASLFRSVSPSVCLHACLSVCLSKARGVKAVRWPAWKPEGMSDVMGKRNEHIMTQSKISVLITRPVNTRLKF